MRNIAGLCENFVVQAPSDHFSGCCHAAAADSFRCPPERCVYIHPDFPQRSSHARRKKLCAHQYLKFCLMPQFYEFPLCLYGNCPNDHDKLPVRVRVDCSMDFFIKCIRIFHCRMDRRSTATDISISPSCVLFCSRCCKVVLQ